MPIAGILFDKDGTLFDFHASWSLWALDLIHELSAGNGDLAQDLATRLGFDLQGKRFHADSLSIAGTVAEQAAAIAPLLPQFTRAELVALLVSAAEEARMVPVDGLAGILEALRGRALRLGVATNDAETAAQAHLEREGLIHHFDFIAGFDSGFGAKPEPGMCRAFAESLQLDPTSVVMVGDSTHDLIAGRAAGMQVVGVLTGVAERATLAPYADVVLHDVTHLPAWLDQVG